MPVEDFRGLLGRLKEHDNETLFDPAGSVRMSSGVAHAVWSLAAARAPNSTQPAAYYEDVAERSPAAQQPSLSDLRQEIAAAKSLSDLHRLRRSFARLSHPDSRKRTETTSATYQMAAANELIDEAILAMRRGSKP
jgi:hypothetical protein